MLNNLEQRVDQLIDALFYCWADKEDAPRYLKGKRIKYIEAEDFYTKMLIFGFAADLDRFEEITNFAHCLRPAERKKIKIRTGSDSQSDFSRTMTRQFTRQLTRKPTIHGSNQLVSPLL